MTLVKIGDTVLNLGNVTEATAHREGSGKVVEVLIYFATGMSQNDTTDFSVFTGNEARALWQYLTDLSITLAINEAQS